MLIIVDIFNYSLKWPSVWWTKVITNTLIRSNDSMIFLLLLYVAQHGQFFAVLTISSWLKPITIFRYFIIEQWPQVVITLRRIILVRWRKFSSFDAKMIDWPSGDRFVGQLEMTSSQVLAYVDEATSFGSSLALSHSLLEGTI